VPSFFFRGHENSRNAEEFWVASATTDLDDLDSGVCRVHFTLE